MDETGSSCGQKHTCRVHEEIDVELGRLKERTVALSNSEASFETSLFS